MKPIVIIGTYPSGEKEVDVLNKCIDSYRLLGYHIMVVSHLPLDVDTASKVEYTIYDSNNTFLPANMTPYSWLRTPNLTVNIFNAGHTLPICRNMSNALHLAQSLKYTHFIFTESDIVLKGMDVALLESYLHTLEEEDKKMFFFKPEEYRDVNGSYVYETLMFGGDINYFLSTFKPPLDVEEWVNVPMELTLELSFYEMFKHDEDKFLIIHDHSSTILKESDVNLLRYGLFNCEIVRNQKTPDEPVLFIMNGLIIQEPKVADIYVNGVLVNSVTLIKNQYWFDVFKYNDDKVRVEVYDQARTYQFLVKEFIMSRDNEDTFNKKGIFKIN